VSGLLVSACNACGWRGFPARLWCPVCGNFELSSAKVKAGLIAEVAVVSTAVGRELSGDVRIANVVLEGGGTVIARLESGSAGQVDLRSEEGAPVAGLPVSHPRQ